MKSVMVHQFSQVPKAQIPRSQFNRSSGYKTTFDSGYLVPFFVDEVLPGDTFSLKASIFARMATPIVPLMDNLFLETQFFFVPNRLVYENWQKLNGEQENPDDSTDFLCPTVTAPSGGWPVGSIGDYFGLPTEIDGVTVNSLPFRAHNLIYNEWYRDQNLIDSVEVPKGDGPDDPAIFNLLRRGKRHDYFTSALPWPQKGPGVELPLGTTAPVYSTIHDGSIGASIGTSQSNSTLIAVTGNIGYTPGAGNSNAYFPAPSDGSHANTLIADLSQASAATINSLRQAFQIQRLLERDARGGTRYTEVLRAHFGVISPDSRLQRPEYLGGSSTRVHINPVQQTSSSDSTTPQGNLAAFGVVGDTVHGFSKSFVEHGYIIGFVNVRADLTYQQGIDRMWSRRSRFEFYWPSLAHLGEQAILNKEIYFQNADADEDVFGYQERWAEYRYRQSKITGKFRSSYAQPLDIWHLSQSFDSLPILGPDFINDTPPVDRVIAVPSEPQFIMDCHFSLRCARPMPVYSVPGLIDHF